MARFLVLLSCLLILLGTAVGLQVTPGSQCATLCLDNPESDPLNPASSSTNPWDISCSDDEFSETSKGIKFKNCVDCLQESQAVNGEENDAAWFLYNLRYSVDVCLFGFPNVSKPISSPCDINYACQPLKTSLEAGILDTNGTTTFEYCDADGSRFSGASIDACVQCLKSSTNQEHLANFITALRAGCQQRPQPGALLGLSGSLFTEYLVNITAPPSNNTATSDSGSTTTMTTGAIVGIAVGAALLFLGGTALFWVYYRKQKRLYESDFISQYDSRGGSMSVTPPLKGAYTTFHSRDNSAMSQYELRAQAAYTSNADYYAELEKDMSSRQPNYHFDPNQCLRGPHSALPTHPAYIPRAMSRLASREPSPEPPIPIRSNRPDAFAVNSYLNASADGSAHGSALANQVRRNTHQESLPPPPAGLPPPAMNRGPSSGHDPTQPLLTGAPPPPPPPPPPRAPRLTLPSVPKLRGAKKRYSPPTITVEDATPIAGPGEAIPIPIGLEISNPLVQHRHRFANELGPPAGLLIGNQHAHGAQPAPVHFRRQLASRRTPSSDFITIHTDGSTMYG
ncbi:hypothetical protein JX265_011816 [Neoarthrinium moseri]|uniref:Exo-alpha-sialidase / neuraminidase n=1 Tax=Neoarthrinium moseri TaxID=1658444 RepID=A0A9P9WBP3_9PEZI|nr:hypothetical protein JX265_011816 [Neoarthrinium moseri]